MHSFRIPLTNDRWFVFVMEEHYSYSALSLNTVQSISKCHYTLLTNMFEWMYKRMSTGCTATQVTESMCASKPGGLTRGILGVDDLAKKHLPSRVWPNGHAHTLSIDYSEDRITCECTRARFYMHAKPVTKSKMKCDKRSKLRKGHWLSNKQVFSSFSIAVHGKVSTKWVWDADQRKIFWFGGLIFLWSNKNVLIGVWMLRLWNGEQFRWR